MNAPDIHGQWIWYRGEERPANFYLYVRTSFDIQGGVRGGSIRLTADSRYRLFINGEPVAFGPARSDRHWQCMDEWDITQYLHPGTNTVAALVHHYGEWTFAYMLGRGGFLADIALDMDDGTSLRFGSDASWRVKPAEAWERRLPRMSIQLDFPEVYDARKEITGWSLPGFDDSDWETALILGPPGMEPWPRLVPRDIPAMRDVPLQADRVMEWGEVGSATTGHFLDILRVLWNTSNGVAYLLTYVWSPAEVDVEIHAGSQDAIRLWVNGNMVISHLVTRDPAPDQEIVPVHLQEGWNTVLAKIVQGEGQWHFYFRFEGEGAGKLTYARSREGIGHSGGDVAPWWLIAPFECSDLRSGFETRYPPEDDRDLQKTYSGKNGKPIRWISAGVTAETMLTSVLMSREERFPYGGEPVEHPEGLVGKGNPAVVHPGAEHGQYLLFDFGREVAGYPVVEIDHAVGGEIIDMGYGEVLQTRDGDILPPSSTGRGILNPDRSGVHYADRYICKPGRQRFQTFEKRAFRYMQIDVRGLTSPIAIGPVSLLLSIYPVEFRGRFSCSDDVLSRIWEIGRWTVALNMEDAYTDCPWRERGQWWGDARIQALVNYYAFGDHCLIRRGLRQISQSQTREGLTMGVYPTEWPYGILPTFTLLWIISVRDYYQYSGDRELVSELMPAVVKAICYFDPFVRDHNLLRDVPHWLFVDWANVETGGESASVNALYYGAVCAAAELLESLQMDARSAGFRTRAATIRTGMDAYLWDNTRNLYRDNSSGEKSVGRFSEQANCWAVVFGVAQGEKAESIIDGLVRHRTSIVQIGTPYFAFYMLDALANVGRYMELLEYIRTHWSRMLDWGATTWWEQWEPKASFCHGWSAGPTFFLQAEILGAKPALPGWEEISLRPQTGVLRDAEGTVPTPFGDVRVSWMHDREGALHLTVEVPRKTTVDVPVTAGQSVFVELLNKEASTPIHHGPRSAASATYVLPEGGRVRFQVR